MTEPQPRPPRRLRWYHRVVIYILIIYLVWCAALYLMQDAMMFPIKFAGQPDPGPWRADAVVLTHDIGGGEVATAWLFPSPGSSSEQPAPLVVYFHGNAELIDYQQRIVDRYHDMGVSVLLPEYRGYGHSGGRPSQAGLVGDALAFIGQVQQRGDIDTGRLVLHGRSLGGAVAAQVAARQKPSVLVLESTFTHTGAFAWRYGVPPLPLFVRNPFRTRDVLPTLGSPVLIFHGDSDPIIPNSHGRKLHERTPGSRLIFYHTQHNDFPGEHEEEFWDEVEGFLDDHDVAAEKR